MSARDGSQRLRALVIQHEQPTPGGHVHEWLAERRAEQELFRIDLDERAVDPRDFDLIVSLGSEYAAFDDSIPWVKRERRLLAAAVEADTPVLGICFGGQLLARTLGGRSFRGEDWEIGWLPVRTRDPLLVPSGPWFQWHFDTFTAPPGAQLVADSPVGPQAFRIDRNLGLQFHPEVTPEIMDEWVRVYRHELDQDGVDPQQLLDETYRRAAETRAAAWRLFDGFLHEVAGLAEGAGTPAKSRSREEEAVRGG